MNLNALSVSDYLTAQLQQIVAYGPGHFLHYASSDNPCQWLQISVHGGVCCHLTAQFVLSRTETRLSSRGNMCFGDSNPHADKRTLDRVFRQFGGIQAQGLGDSIIVYHLAPSAEPAELYSALTTVGTQCAQALCLLWNARRVEQILLLAARGPRIAIGKQHECPPGDGRRPSRYPCHLQ